MGKLIDETGNRYGKLVVIKRAPNQKTSACWLCQCDCGNMVVVRGGDLRYGRKSCGCIKKQNLEKHNKEIFKDLTGKKFGYLTVLEKSPNYGKNNMTLWICQCICGKKIEVQRNNLLSGNTLSCGCKRTSRGENKIKELLTNNNIKFISEKTFSNCRFSSTNQLAKFDFFVDDKYIIEYDGEQHFHDVSYFHDTIKEVQQRDKIKNQWCRDNNIPLIRIPYTHYNDITLSDLLPETSQFLVK